MSNIHDDPMLEIYIFETSQLIEQLENLLLSVEKNKSFNHLAIDEIFRIMHTIKGSASLMLFTNISELTHEAEDLFYLLRENKFEQMDFTRITDIVLEVIDFMKIEISKIQSTGESDGTPIAIINKIRVVIGELKEQSSHTDTEEQSIRKSSKKKRFYMTRAKTPKINNFNSYKANIHFEDDCQMENMRAFTVIHNLNEIAKDIQHFPVELFQDEKCIEIIREHGFVVSFKSEKSIEEVRSFLFENDFLKNLKIETVGDVATIEIKNDIENNSRTAVAAASIKLKDEQNIGEDKGTERITQRQKMISVSVDKLDILMDLVGELVISEAMVTQHPELTGLPLNGFHKAARQLKKITNELQDIAMSMRMVPLIATFQKMNRLVRDMSRNVGKEVDLKIAGEDTEVDKNVIEQISDPLMHIVRNAVDHGLETPEERTKKGKAPVGTITLEAKNTGGDVWITIKDDGKGLDKEKILKKAQENELLDSIEGNLADKDIYALIFKPGFSTKDQVTEYSGRGVGMDVVAKNVEKVRGKVYVDSIEGMGTTISIRIPLTLAIIDGMITRVGKASYTIPMASIRESFRPKPEDIINDPEGNELILIRGSAYPILRIHEQYHVNTNIIEFHEGVLVVVENEHGNKCLFVDALVGTQQIVVKALPEYIKKVKGITGCTLLGDGSISLILDVADLLN